jgi:hypothetical protein
MGTPMTDNPAGTAASCRTAFETTEIAGAAEVTPRQVRIALAFTPARRIDIGLNENGVVLFGAAILLFGAVCWASFGPLREKTDFSVTYLGARIVRQGDGARLYDLGEQETLKQALYKDKNPLIFEHPPFEALLLSSLAALPYQTAYLLWGLLNALIWLVLPYILRPYAPVPRETLGYFALWFLFAPLGVALFQGQPSLILLLLYTLAYINLKRGRDLRAGLLLGLGLFKFQFVLPFVLIFLLRKKWKLLVGFLASATMLGSLSVIAVGPRGVVSYVGFLLKIASNPHNASFGNAIGMATVGGFVHSVLGHIAGTRTVDFIVGAVSLFLILFTAWRWRRLDREGRGDSSDLMFAAAVVVSLVDGFHMFAHDLSPLLLAMLLVAAHFPPKGRPALRLALGATLALLWIPGLHFGLLALHCSYLMFPILVVFGVATLRLAERPGLVTTQKSLGERHAT